MSRYIDAEELIFFGFDNPDDDNLFEFVPKEFIDNATTADVREVVHGEWTDTTHGLICSACKTYQVYGNRFYNFCPFCGAEMKNGEKHEQIH